MKKILFILIFLVTAAGCDWGNYTLFVKYDRVDGLKEGDQVIFDKNHIGDVKNVKYTESGHYIASLGIKKDFSTALTDQARFFIIDNPGKAGEKAIEMVQLEKGGSPLKKGMMIDGSTKTATIFKHMRKDFDKGVKEFKNKIEDLTKTLRKIPESEEVKKFERDLGRFAEEIKKSGKSAKDKIEKEVLPVLRKELEKLRKRLKEHGREKEMEPLDNQMEKIKAI